jgi:tetratricopeptide (TPR) repeat protein
VDDATADARAVFSWSYRALSDAAAGLFRLLGLAPGPDLAVGAAASLAGQPVARVRRVLAELDRAHLVDQVADGRYGTHDLLHAYAAELALDVDPEELRREAIHRVLDHYLHSVVAADRWLNPHRSAIALDAPRPGVVPEVFAAEAAARAWIVDERAALVSAVHHAAAGGLATHCWQLACTAAVPFGNNGYWHDKLAMHRCALQAVHRSGDTFGQAHARRGLGAAYALLGDRDRAMDHLRRAIDLFIEVGDRDTAAVTHLNITFVYGTHDGACQPALDHARRALDLFRATGHLTGLARAHKTVGWFLALLGEYGPAVAHCDRALALHPPADRMGLSRTWHTLGYVHHRLGDLVRAVACYEKALRLAEDCGDRYNEARFCLDLGDAHDESGDLAGARSAWERALAGFEGLGHAQAEDARTRLKRG